MKRRDILFMIYSFDYLQGTLHTGKKQTIPKMLIVHICLKMFCISDSAKGKKLAQILFLRNN